MSLKQSLQKVIASRGPISVAAYMHQSLVHPREGYYTTRDPLGAKGDFITSPEISQMFGELIGINLITQWLAHGQPSKIRLVELGPGRGTLMADLLRAAKTFPSFFSTIKHLDLIEASPELQKKQQDTLRPFGTELNWLDSVREVPHDGVHTFVVAHEFFDALPIHQYRKVSKGNWLERLVDYDPKLDAFKFVWAPQPDKMVSISLEQQTRFSALPENSEIEVCYEALEIARQLAALISHNKGGALIIDYGPMATIPVNTFRGFKEHHQVEPLAVAPGEADLTADVDFRALQDVFTGLYCTPVVKQGDWLHRMGIGARATVLANNQKSDEGVRRVESAYNRLVDPNHMGKTYKFLGFSSLSKPIEGFQAVSQSQGH